MPVPWGVPARGRVWSGEGACSWGVPGPRGGACSWEGVSRPTPKGEIEGDQVQAHTQGGN